MGGAKIAVKLQSGVSTQVGRSKGSYLSTRRSTEGKAAAVTGSSIGSSANPLSTNTPRQVRVRLSSGTHHTSRTTPQKRTAPSEMTGLGLTPDSPVAINRGIGRTAVGPWCGPFEMSASAADHEPLSPTLFMDRAGSAHRSLRGSLPHSAAGKRGSSLDAHAPVIDYSVGFPGGLELPASTRRAELRDHSREVRLAASKGEPKGSAEARCAPRFAGGSAKRHAGHQVFQPSGRFY